MWSREVTFSLREPNFIWVGNDIRWWCAKPVGGWGLCSFFSIVHPLPISCLGGWLVLAFVFQSPFLPFVGSVFFFFCFSVTLFPSMFILVFLAWITEFEQKCYISLYFRCALFCCSNEISGCQLFSRKCNSGNCCTWVFIFLYGVKLQTYVSCLNVFATSIIMCVIKQTLFVHFAFSNSNFLRNIISICPWFFWIIIYLSPILIFSLFLRVDIVDCKLVWDGIL